MLPHKAAAGTLTASDDFNRADGGLGPNWTAVSDGAMAISSQAVTGAVNVTTGEIRTAETYASDQYSQVEVTSTQLTGGVWIGPAVRLQGGGQDGYVGIYFWNFGSPELMLFERNAGNWTQLGAYGTAPLAAGTQLRLVAAGSTISFLENGVPRISVTDSTFTGGAPGIMAHGNAEADNWAGGDIASYSVGGSVSGLSGTVVLQDNGGDDLSVSADGSFTFDTPVADGAGYQVTVKTNPSGQACTVSSGSGTVSGGNVTNVAVSCTTNSATSATDDFNRADGGLGPNWTAVSDGAMAISSQAVTGAVNVTTGEIRTAETYASDQYSQVEVTSTQLTGGVWIGPAVRLQGGGQDGYVGIYFWNFGSPELMLFERNAGNWTQLGAYGTAPLAAGTQLRLVAAGSTISFLENGVPRISVTDSTFTGGAPGIMAHGNAEADNWAGGSGAGPASYSVGGSVSGLSGTVVLQDNGGDDLSVSADGSFTFDTPVADGAGYQVTVKTNPSGQACTVSSGSGTVSGGNVTNVAVSCRNVASYSVGGSVSGLSGTVVLQDNGGDDLSVSADGSFTFDTPVADGAGYQVTVKTNPSGQACTVSSGSGTVSGGNVTNVAVSCRNVASYSVGGSVSGLSGTVVLQDNGGDDLSVSADGSFTFDTPVADGAGYQVTVKTNPSGQACTVSSGSGTVSGGNVTNVAVSCTTNSAGSFTDDFDRADGGLGPNWTAMSDGAMAISSQAVIGTVGTTTGEIRTGETYPSDQYSQVEVTSTQLTGGQWIGPAVRVQNGGQGLYLGIYFWNFGSPELMLFERNAGNWTELNAYNTAPLAAGTQLRLVAAGNTIAFLENGVQRISFTDNTLTGGAPGIMADGNAEADNWSGGPDVFQVSYDSTNAQGIKSYDVISADNGYGPQTLRVLTPTAPASGVAHNFLIVLPVEAGLASTDGDGIGTLQTLNAQNQYNLTIIEPTFAIESWYANSPNDTRLQYETFVTQDLVPWIKQNLATSGNEQTWLIGFSKSGIGAQDLILKHPDLFTLAASWDFPADMSSDNQFGGAPTNYGTDANFQANYRLTSSFLDAHKGPFLSNNRIWIGGYSVFKTDISDYDALLTSEGIVHSTETPQNMPHRWDSGWVPIALAALYQDSINLH